ncbi:c-type cytochrome biogenesis protein CcmI [Marinobacter sp. SS5-14b]|uniref:c-type cytochrome biogenesis protein CcmI n=1 Tax=Marinobacter sp. SS5-14b TaxID=3050456 RepID=UPI0026E0A811|nr:c-type cytochrome biogenesis protein CcmI [Marinobacter sp. SS5-14b]
MTETFWIAAAVLILFALAFVLYPVFFHRPKSRIESDLRNQNLLAYKSRLRELDEEHEAGVLDDETYEQLKDELAGSMLDDVPEHAVPEKHVPGRRSAMAVGLLAILLIPAVAFYAYQQWGSMDQVEQFITMQQMDASGNDQVARMAELADQLRQRLEAAPDNADGWAMLGQTYMRIEKYRDAAEAYQRLAGVVAEDPSASAVAYGLSAQALFFDTEGQMTADVQQAISNARALNPDEVNSLGLLGIHAFSQQNYREAIEYWGAIVDVAPDHPQIAAIRGGIAEAYTRLGETPPAEPGAEAAEPSAGVDLRVSLDDAFLDQVPADTTLFIFARAAGTSSGAPVAVARLNAGALPADIRLDDSYAMSPQATISSAQEVVIVARLSRSGTINPQPGDWQGQVEAEVLSPGAESQRVELVINQQLTN